MAALFATLLLFASALYTAHSFSALPTKHRRSTLKAQKKDGNDGGVDKDMNPLVRGSWYAVEAFGSIFGEKDSANNDIDMTEAPSSLQETLARIKEDNTRSYFLSGQVDREIYDADCIFADPFVSFSGRDRFVDNLQNLGSFITNYSAKVLDYNVESDSIVKTRIMVKLELNLPWKPILAWPWGVEYTVDPETNLITSHVESWDIPPVEGVKQIFRRPTTSISS